jgi:hypothetical protein
MDDRHRKAASISMEGFHRSTAPSVFRLTPVFTASGRDAYWSCAANMKAFDIVGTLRGFGLRHRSPNPLKTWKPKSAAGRPIPNVPTVVPFRDFIRHRDDPSTTGTNFAPDPN